MKARDTYSCSGSDVNRVSNERVRGVSFGDDAQLSIRLDVQVLYALRHCACVHDAHGAVAADGEVVEIRKGSFEAQVEVLAVELVGGQTHESVLLSHDRKRNDEVVFVHDQLSAISQRHAARVVAKHLFSRQRERLIVMRKTQLKCGPSLHFQLNSKQQRVKFEMNL